ncbi:MAG: hypothetical protein GX823_05785 [Clostridiales bacterium]|nr:hypothetical protein [Clostridiales bacterium]
MKAALVIMAAGLGSRYGGEKQVDGYGPHGETIMEYSAFDAVRAGFTKIVFIIKPHMLDAVRDMCGDRLAGLRAGNGEPVRVEYVFQDFSSVPSFYKIPEGRTKPFGTVHAALCAMPVVQEPFALINADDFYGREAYEAIYGALGKLPQRGEALMVGYRLGNTVSDNGTVTRGVCAQEGGVLKKIKETYKIKKYPDGRICDTENPENEVPLDPDMIVSMNFWGFTPWIFEKLEMYFRDFLKSLPDSELKAECLLPSMVDELIARGELRVPILPSDSKWFGVTYKEDKPVVVEELSKLHRAGIYPPSLRD